MLSAASCKPLPPSVAAVNSNTTTSVTTVSSGSTTFGSTECQPNPGFGPASGGPIAPPPTNRDESPIKMGNQTPTVFAPCNGSDSMESIPWLPLKYHGKWTNPDAPRIGGRIVQTASIVPGTKAGLSAASGAVDSGASGSMTPDESRLVNIRPCTELFRSATGAVSRCSCIGDMPVVVKTKGGKLYRLLIRNVRCVPSFKYTLLSVIQLWKEQRIDSKFRDIMALVVEQTSDEVLIPYDLDCGLPSVKLIFTATVPADSKLLSSLSALAAVKQDDSGDDLEAEEPPGLAEAGDDEDDEDMSMKDLRGTIAASLSPSEPRPAAELQSALLSLGFHRVGTSAHVGKLSAAQAAELLHRRSHAGIDKIRAMAHTTQDAPKNLSSATSVCTCLACATARAKKAPHSGRLHAPAPEPGTLHVDLKEMVLSKEGYRYAVFAIDEHTRYVFVEFIKRKSEVVRAMMLIRAAFNATVATPIDESGNPLPRPTVRIIHSDREGGLMSGNFTEFRADASIHHTTSPPHDHDLNPIAERIIGLISENAAAIKLDANAPIGFWPWLITYAVDWHNSMNTSAGTSTADVNISPHQRLTLTLPRIMDLHAFGCRAVVLKPAAHQHKPSLPGRGWVGAFLGRARNSRGCWAVWTGTSIVESSGIAVDEETYVWKPRGEQTRPLTAASRAPRQEQRAPIAPSTGVSGSLASAPATTAKRLRALSLFSGPYSRAGGLPAALRALGWDDISQVDNDGKHGGGWAHDMLNDATFAGLYAKAAAGEWDAIMVAFMCNTATISRFFDASTDERDRGPPPVRTASDPDGLPEDKLDVKHARELAMSNLLLTRTVSLLIAARKSPARTTIIFENPVDRSVENYADRPNPAYSEKFKEHGSIFATSFFKKLLSEVEMLFSTFAYCRLGSEYQKYTTLYYTPEAAPVLSQLNKPEFACNHPIGSHASRAGGRGPDGEFISSRSAAYPARLNALIAQALTFARTGSAEKPRQIEGTTPTGTHTASEPASGNHSWWQGQPTPPAAAGLGSSPAPASAHGLPTAPASGGFSLDLGGASPADPSAPSPLPFRDLSSETPGAPAANVKGRRDRKPVDRLDKGWAERHPRGWLAKQQQQQQQQQQPPPPPTPPPSAAPTTPSSADQYADTYSPFDAMEGLVADLVYSSSLRDDFKPGEELVPIGNWADAPSVDARMLLGRSTRLPGGQRAIEINVSLGEGETFTSAFLAELQTLGDEYHGATGYCLRADSPDAPATHGEAVKRGEVWVKAEGGEMGNHHRNGSWVLIPRSEVPRGRRIHKLIWVYKVKRDGSAKARLCVQGSTLEAGIDYDQAFSAALRYSSARTLFAFAARHGCRVRSIDLVAAYLQGTFLDGEVVYCSQAQGHVELGPDGEPLIARVVKPIYGIQQAGRRLQRELFDWFLEQDFEQLDDSDNCVFTKSFDNGEILRIGVYVDNLQVVHSVEIDEAGRGPDGCHYNEFYDAFAARWDVVDEGPMEDLLGIEVEYLADGSIKLHQEKYIKKVVERFLPKGPLPNVQRNTLPYTSNFYHGITEALAQSTCLHPELVGPFQQRIGCLMYAATSTRPDIAFAVHKLCTCLQKPTPALMHEVDVLLSYLSRHASVGLTYTGDIAAKLVSFADASWETRHSTSGWVTLWQQAALTWGSRKQKSIALSTAEAEIIALSEATKDVVYLRKLLAGVGDAQPDPSVLFTDSKAARDISYNPEQHDRMKHVQRRHFFVRDMVESFEITVPYVATADNIADFFTKQMHSWKQFYRFRRVIMNEPDPTADEA